MLSAFPLALVGRVVIADAMPTQSGLAEYLVEEKQADYVFTVKDNQQILKRHLTQANGGSPPPLDPDDPMQQECDPAGAN